MFINRTANKAPSGIAAFHLKISVRAAAHTAKIYLPGIVTGDVTGSVSMNTETNSTPPPKTLNNAKEIPDPFANPVIRDTANTVSTYGTVRCQSMTSLYTR